MESTDISNSTAETLLRLDSGYGQQSSEYQLLIDDYGYHLRQHILWITSRDECQEIQEVPG